MIYKENDKKGWIIISEKSSSKVTIVGMNESYKRYKLDRINTNYVVYIIE